MGAKGGKPLRLQNYNKKSNCASFRQEKNYYACINSCFVAKESIA